MRPEECEKIKRGYAEIDLDAIAFNIANMKNNLPARSQMVLVIKTDGYGHGAYPIAAMAENMDCVWGYAVATPEEAFELRSKAIAKPILILGYSFDYAYEEMIEREVRGAVFREDTLKALADAARKLNKNAIIHIKVDTGMSRIGITPDEEGLDFVKKAVNTPGITVEGIFTHFARADETDKSYVNRQIDVFSSFSKMASEAVGVRIPLIHCANSAAIMELPRAHMDLVRAGITLYGLYPSDEVDKDSVSLRPVMSLISHISYIKRIASGTQVSYGGTYAADGDRMIATVPIGYGDGYPRALSNIGSVLIRGKSAPIRGRVCMDQFMVDVTDIPDAAMGDKVTLLGTDGVEKITMEQLGDLSGRFNYEFACDIGRRIPRVYTMGGEIKDIILDGKSIK